MGVMPLAPLWTRKVDEWELMIDVNLRGVLLGVAAVLPTMQEQGWGHIVNVAPMPAEGVSPNAAVYCGTQYAIDAVSEGLRQEHAGRVRVTVVRPDVSAQDSTLAVPAEAVARSIAGAIEGGSIAAPPPRRPAWRPRPAAPALAF